MRCKLPSVTDVNVAGIREAIGNGDEDRFEYLGSFISYDYFDIVQEASENVFFAGGVQKGCCRLASTLRVRTRNRILTTFRVRRETIFSAMVYSSRSVSLRNTVLFGRNRKFSNTMRPFWYLLHIERSSVKRGSFLSS